MRYEGNKVVSSEQELKWLVNESVKNIIKEERLDEWWGQNVMAGLRGAGKKVGGDAQTATNSAMDTVGSGLSRAANYVGRKAGQVADYVGDKAGQVKKYGQAVNANYQAHYAAQQIKGYINNAVDALTKLKEANTKLAKYKMGGALTNEVIGQIDNVISVLQSTSPFGGATGRADVAQNTIWNEDPTKR